MNLQKEREAFERLPLAELAIKCKYVYYNEKTNSYWPNEDFCPSDAPETMNFAWEAWQAAIARMEVRINTLDEILLNQGEALAQAKAQAVLEEKGRSDFEIIAQTIELVDLIAGSNRFQRDKSTPFPFESNNPRNIEWWRLACKIQELLTDTDPENCDFDEYKAMIEAQENE